MTTPPKVSVIIPCFNHGEFLPEAVASVTSMHRPDVELIVVDDGSTDERTRNELAALVGRGIRVIRQENKGPAAARNAAIRPSKGEYIFPLDADDRARPASIERAIRILDANPPTGVVYGDVEHFGTRTSRWVTGSFNARRLLQNNYLCCSSLFRRLVWEQNGGFDERMLDGYEDWDFWVGAFEHGWQFAYVPEALFEYRQHGESVSSRVLDRKEQVAQFIAQKHSALYRRDWLQLTYEHDSGAATFRNLRRIIKARIKHKFGMNGDHVE